MFRLQSLVFPQKEICTEEKLYFRSSDALYNYEKKCIYLKKGQEVLFNTYYNIFSLKKWNKYTRVKRVALCLKGEGLVNIRCKLAEWDNGNIMISEQWENKAYLRETEDIVCSIEDVQQGEAFFFEIYALEDAKIKGGSYICPDLIELENIKIAIDICTFRREEYIEKNLKILNSAILENPDLPLYGKVEVFVSDNGKTLDIDKLETDKIHIVQNKNAGGASGFTRGLIEILKIQSQKKFSHILLMDDDIVIEPEAIIRTYALLACLKEEYADVMVGGAMLKLNEPYEQHEAGARWNAGECTFFKRGLDLRNEEVVLWNEVEEEVEYQAWWYCCIPMTTVNESNLPLPMFIHQDDVEYGLRAGKNILYLNGISVWHQSFENKRPSVNEYYDIRNRLIVNAVYCPEFGLKQVKKMIKTRLFGNLLVYRYRDIELNARAVRDFCKGIDWWEQCDGSALHRELAAMGYKMSDIDDVKGMIQEKMVYDKDESYPRKPKGRLFGIMWSILRRISFNGWFLPAKKGVYCTGLYPRVIWLYRRKSVLFCDSDANQCLYLKREYKKIFYTISTYFSLCKELNDNYAKAKESYQTRIKEVQNIDFWKRYLELEGK